VKRLSELDVLRGVAALSVFCYHYHLFKYGYLGVHLFFIISGFVILMTAENSRNASQFFVNRILRLLPVYWLCVSIAFGVRYFSNEAVGVKMYLVNLTMLQEFLGVEKIDGVYWTLAEEWIFYGIIIVLLAASNAKKNVVVILFLLLLAFCGLLIDETATGHVREFRKACSYLGLFSAGMLFYRMYSIMLRGSDRFKEYRALEFAALLVTLFCALMITTQYRFGAYVHVPGYNSSSEAGIISVFFLTLCGVVFRVARAPSMKYLIVVGSFAGRISYPFYLLHCVVGKAIYATLQRSCDIPPSCVLLTTFLLVVLMSYIMHIYIEVRFTRRVKSKFLSEKSPA